MGISRGRSPRPWSPIDIRIGASHYVGPGRVHKKFQPDRVTPLPPSDTQHCQVSSLFSFLFLFFLVFFFFWGSCSSAQVRRPHRFWPFMGHKTCFGVRKCLLGVRIVKKYFYPYFGGKNMKFKLKSQCALSHLKIEQKRVKMTYFRHYFARYLSFLVRGIRMWGQFLSRK